MLLTTLLGGVLGEITETDMASSAAPKFNAKRQNPIEKQVKDRSMNHSIISSRISVYILA